MYFKTFIKIYLFLMFIKKTTNEQIRDSFSDLSYNQPIFCPNASWNPYAFTFANSPFINGTPFGIFITTMNSVYASTNTGDNNYTIYIWPDSNVTLTIPILFNSSYTRSIFVTKNNEMYYGFVSNTSQGISKLSLNFSTEVLVVKTNSECYGIFIDILDNIYCSLVLTHRVIKKSLDCDPTSNISVTIAGTGSAGSSSTTLNNPNGIFVDTNFDLYVADCLNDRIQLFPLGQLNGITIAGTASLTPTITLNRPTAVILDRNKYLFIADYGNSRIVGNNQYGYRCIVGCNETRGSAANELNYPRSLSFDSFGNIFVADQFNYRIQKFSLMTNSCSKFNETIPINTNNAANSSINIYNFVSVNTSNHISYNLPKFDPFTVWNPNGITFADNNTIGTFSLSIFIDKNNTVYVPGQSIDRIQIWANSSSNPTNIIYTNSMHFDSIFVTSNGDIYTGEAIQQLRIRQWTLNTNISSIVAYADGRCYGLFVDLNNTIYFSIRNKHKVMSRPLTTLSNALTIVAGTGCIGNTLTTLNRPHGIFVDDNFDLYVTDTSNNRIQLFRSGSRNGTTVAGNGSINVTISLNIPMGVILDADKYLFIVDTGNHRIIGSGSNGFRCIVGCSNSAGSASNQFSNPRTIAFDSFGNLFVVDADNSRIQKFLFMPSSCYEITTQQSTNVQTNCDMLIPCRNQGTCFNNISYAYGYICQCKDGFNGTNCQNDQRPCKPSRCWNNGICTETSNITFECLCQSGYTGINCRTMIDYCKDDSCQNDGVCRLAYLNFTCECLGDSYLGQFCEKDATRTVILRIAAKSISYIVIIFLISTAAYIVIMDVLKYCFDIDLAKTKSTVKSKIKHRPVIQKFIYIVNKTTENLQRQTSNIIL